MKKTGYMAVFVLSILLAGCGVQEEKTQAKTLREQGEELTVLLDEMVHNDSYIEAFTGSGEIKEVAEHAAEGDRSELTAVYELTFAEEYFTELLDGAELIDTIDMSDELKENFKQRMLSSLLTQLNAREGTAKLAASAVCTVSESFVNKELQADTIYVYIYKNAQPATVTFLKGNDGAVQGTACFLMNEDLKGAGKEKLEEYFSELQAELKEVQ